MSGLHRWHPTFRRWHGIDVRHVFAGATAAAVVIVTMLVVLGASVRPPAPGLSALPSTRPTASSSSITTPQSPVTAPLVLAAPRAPVGVLRGAPAIVAAIPSPLALPLAVAIATTPPAAAAASSRTSSARPTPAPPPVKETPAEHRWTTADVTAALAACIGRDPGLSLAEPGPELGTLRSDPPAWPCVPVTAPGPAYLWVPGDYVKADAACAASFEAQQETDPKVTWVAAHLPEYGTSDPRGETPDTWTQCQRKT